MSHKGEKVSLEFSRRLQEDAKMLGIFKTEMSRIFNVVTPKIIGFERTRLPKTKTQRIKVTFQQEFDI